jgi:cephalosporin-C deacetylase
MPQIDLPLRELEAYTGRNPRPLDHDAFWQRALSELGDTAPDLELVPASFRAASAECFDLFFTGVGGARVHAKYLRPRHAAAAHPAIVMFHGYTGSSGDWADKLIWVERGFSVAAMDCRGQGGQSEDVGGVRGSTQHGHIIRGLEDHEDRLLFRQVFLDTVQLARLIMNQPEVDPERVGACGASQGGALTLACAALEPRIRRASAVYPFLSDYQRVWEMDLAEGAYAELRTFFRQRDPTHARFDQWFERLGYIDIQFLAPRIRAEVLMGIGLMDKICPPSTQYAAYNKIRAPKRAIIYPDFAHEHLPGYADLQYEFLGGL